MLSPRQAAVCIAVLTGLAYLNSFGGEFVFDDVPEIALNPALDQLLPPWEAMFHGHKSPARPLPYLSTGRSGGRRPSAITSRTWQCMSSRRSPFST